jgi:hypothetical protein
VTFVLSDQLIIFRIRRNAAVIEIDSKKFLRPPDERASPKRRPTFLSAAVAFVRPISGPFRSGDYEAHVHGAERRARAFSEIALELKDQWL